MKNTGENIYLMTPGQGIGEDIARDGRAAARNTCGLQHHVSLFYDVWRIKRDTSKAASPL